MRECGGYTYFGRERGRGGKGEVENMTEGKNNREIARSSKGIQKTYIQISFPTRSAILADKNKWLLNCLRSRPGRRGSRPPPGDLALVRQDRVDVLRPPQVAAQGHLQGLQRQERGVSANFKCTWLFIRSETWLG